MRHLLLCPSYRVLSGHTSIPRYWYLIVLVCGCSCVGAFVNCGQMWQRTTQRTACGSIGVSFLLHITLSDTRKPGGWHSGAKLIEIVRNGTTLLDILQYSTKKKKSLKKACFLRHCALGNSSTQVLLWLPPGGWVLATCMLDCACSLISCKLFFIIVGQWQKGQGQGEEVKGHTRSCGRKEKGEN